MSVTVDNRDLIEMCAYYESRIEALARRVKDLEAENRELLAESAQLREQIDAREAAIAAMRHDGHLGHTGAE